MSLDELIAQITNPQDFTRLCNTIFTDIYGHNFQVIDGSRSDNGNDGYIIGERRVLAMYCPIKPEQKTDAAYLKKIRSDLNKAAALKSAKKYEIEAWTFVTPRKLGDNVISGMREYGAELGIPATHQESTFLANELYRRKHLLHGFPQLNFVDLSAQISQIREILLTNVQKQPASQSSPEMKYEPVDEEGDRRFHELMDLLPSKDAKAELKAIAYRTLDPILELNAILCLFRWFDPADDDRAELLAFAQRGIARASKSGLSDAEAMLHAQTAAMLAWDFNLAYSDAYFCAISDALSPVAGMPLERVQLRWARLQELEQKWRNEASIALDMTKQSNDYESVAGVLVIIGTAVGQVAQILKHTNANETANRFLTECKALLLSAKDIYAAAGDELGAVNAAFNLANQIRWHGGVDEASALAMSAIEVAQRHGDLLLLQKAKWLLHTLETGKMPDYMAGERRAWSTDLTGSV